MSNIITIEPTSNTLEGWRTLAMSLAARLETKRKPKRSKNGGPARHLLVTLADGWSIRTTTYQHDDSGASAYARTMWTVDHSASWAWIQKPLGGWRAMVQCSMKPPGIVDICPIDAIDMPMAAD